MTKPEPPHLRLVGVGAEDDLEGVFDDDEADDPLDSPASTAQQPKPQRKRLTHSRKEFSRVPWYWLKISARDGGFPPWVRLYLCLWYRTHEGKEWVPLTARLTAEAGIDRLNKLRELGRLEVRGLVEVHRHGQEVPLVRALPYPRGRRR